MATAGAAVAMTGLFLFVSHLLGSTAFYCLMPRVWRTIVSHIHFACCVVVSGREVSLISLEVNFGHKWKSLELHLSRKLVFFCFVFKG